MPSLLQALAKVKNAMRVAEVAERQPILAGGNDMLRRHRLEVVIGMAMAEPIQKTRANRTADAGLWLKGGRSAFGLFFRLGAAARRMHDRSMGMAELAL